MYFKECLIILVLINTVSVIIIAIFSKIKREKSINSQRLIRQVNESIAQLIGTPLLLVIILLLMRSSDIAVDEIIFLTVIILFEIVNLIELVQALELAVKVLKKTRAAKKIKSATLV